MANAILLSLCFSFMLSMGAHGCIRKEAVDVIRLTQCNRLLKNVIITAEDCQESDDFEQAYNKFNELCEKVEEDEEDDGFHRALKSVLETAFPSCNVTYTNVTDATNEIIDEVTDVTNDVFDDVTDEANDIIENVTDEPVEETLDEVTDETNEVIDDATDEIGNDSGEGLQEPLEVLDDANRNLEKKEMDIFSKILELM